MSQAAGRKIQKLNDGVSQSIPQPVKKVPAKALQFKLGKWNPDTVIVDPKEETELRDKSDNLVYKCCVRCNCRNLIRAVETNNIKLLKNCLAAKDKIPELCQAWSSDAPRLTALELILKKQSVEMFEVFFKVPVKATATASEYQVAAEAYFVNDRV